MQPEYRRDFERLYESLRKPLLAFIIQKTGDETKAEDILHDVFLKAQEQLGALNDATKIESWIYSITRNAIADDYRNRKPLSRLELEIDIEERSQETVVEQLSGSVRAFIEMLPEPYKTALMLSDIENMPQQDIAKRLGLSLSGAKSRIQRARNKLKSLYLACCSFEQNRHGVVLSY
ncbi:MAG: sigma-70 family RNA polymerase sigma factor, partial [Chloroherpetonaceae bacterium]